MFEFSFEKLNVSQHSRVIANEVYELTKSLPASEKYIMSNQMRRCSDSVCSNIAEGSGRSSFKDQAHFTTIALGSLYELMCQLILSNDRGWVGEAKVSSLRKEIQTLTINLKKLKSSQLERSLSKPSTDRSIK